RVHWPDRVMGLMRRVRTEQGQNRPASAAAQYRVLQKPFGHSLRRHYFGLIHVPDPRVDWLGTAIPAGRELIRDWMPEIIFGSAPPNTSLIVASRLARACRIPWVADFRDLWTDNPYCTHPGWRRPVDAILERQVLRSVAKLVTVSPNWA